MRGGTDVLSERVTQDAGGDEESSGEDGGEGESSPPWKHSPEPSSTGNKRASD